MAEAKAVRQVTRARPHQFKSSKVRCDFSIATKGYRLESIPSGFLIGSGREQWRVRFNNRACVIEVREGAQKLEMRIDGSRAPDIHISVKSLGQSWNARGSIDEVARSLVSAEIRAPKAVATRLLLSQMRLSPEFASQSAALGASAVLIQNFQPFLLITRESMCIVACALCAAQQILTPGPTPDDLPACLACGVCKFMGW